MRRPTSTQHLVAAAVAEAVVDRLEVVEVDEQDADRRAASCSPRRASACSTRSNSSARLGSPVSESWNARWLSSWRLWRSGSAIALKESATSLSSLNESSSTRWARSPLPRRRAERLRVASGRRIEATSRRASSIAMSTVSAKAITIRTSCERCPVPSRRAWTRIVATTSSASRAVAVSRRLRPAPAAPTSAPGVRERCHEALGRRELAPDRTRPSHPAQGVQVGARAGERARTRGAIASPPPRGARRARSSATSTEAWRFATAATRVAVVRADARVLLSSALLGADAGCGDDQRGDQDQREPEQQPGRKRARAGKRGRTLFPRPLRTRLERLGGSARGGGPGPEVRPRVDRLRRVGRVPAVGPDLEVQVRARGVAGLADLRERLAGGDRGRPWRR